MKRVRIFDIPGQYPVTLQQFSDGLFRVTYGQQVKRDLDYASAAKELGECIMHAMCCAGEIENDV